MCRNKLFRGIGYYFSIQPTESLENTNFGTDITPCNEELFNTRYKLRRYMKLTMLLLYTKIPLSILLFFQRTMRISGHDFSKAREEFRDLIHAYSGPNRTRVFLRHVRTQAL